MLCWYPLAANLRTYSILVVEDKASDAKLIYDAFLDCGSLCRLTLANTLEKAKEALHSIPVDLVLCDVCIENVESDVFIKQIRADSKMKSVPIIIIGGAVNPRPAYEAGANAFVSKSIDHDQFFAKIKALMHFWMDVAELPHSVRR